MSLLTGFKPPRHGAIRRAQASASPRSILERGQDTSCPHDRDCPNTRPARGTTAGPTESSVLEVRPVARLRISFLFKVNGNSPCAPTPLPFSAHWPWTSTLSPPASCGKRRCGEPGCAKSCPSARPRARERSCGVTAVGLREEHAGKSEDAPETRGWGGSAGEGPRPAGAFSTPSQNRSRACALPAPPLVLTHTRGPTHTHTHTRELSRVQSHTRTDAHTPTHSYRQLPGHQTTCQQRQENARDGHLFSGPERLGRVGWRPTPHCLEAPGTEVSAMSGFRSSLAFGLLCNRCVHDLGCDRATCGASDGSSPRGDSR